MSEEKPDDNRHKPKPIILGSGYMGKTAFIQSIINDWEREKGIPVKIWEPKDHPPVSTPLIILDDYRSILSPPDDLPILPITPPEENTLSSL